MAEELFCKSVATKAEQARNIGGYCKTLSFTLRLASKPGGWFRIVCDIGFMATTVHCSVGVDHIVCLSAGHSNQIRQMLSDDGLTGLVEYAL